MTDAVDGEDFLATLAELKRAVADDPARLEQEWEHSPLLQGLCDNLYRHSRTFQVVEEWSRFAFTAHVPATAAQARRDYDDRWARIVSWVAGRDMHRLFETLLGSVEKEGEQDEPSTNRDPLGEMISEWKDLAREEAGCIERMVDHAFGQREVDDFGDFEWVSDSLDAWDRLVRVCGLDLRGALWRRRAIPHILVPSHVSRRYGAKRASLYRRLDQAAKAFIFDAPLAALALQRSVLEEVLRDHWGSEKGHIRDANLPEHNWDIRADRLKRLANEALHSDPEKFSKDQQERAIIESFGLLRLLIEHAPENPAGREGTAQ